MILPKKETNKEYPVRLTLQSIYGDSTWFKTGKVTAISTIEAKLKAKELAGKTELHLTGSFITKIEVKSLSFKTFQDEWEEIA